MKKLLKIKPFLWLVLAVIIGLGLNFLITELRFGNNIKTAQAGDEHSVTGFAWSERIGWISFNSTDCDADSNGYVDTSAADPKCNGDNTTDDVFNYGVHINNGLGHFSGYAWSSNVGWIAFERAKVCDGDHNIYCNEDVDCGTDWPCIADPDIPDYSFNANCTNDADPGNNCTSDNNCTACLNLTGNNVYGWAKIISMGEDGWIRLDDDGSGFNFGVSRNNSDQLEGWAWNNRGLCDDGFTPCYDNTPCGGGTCDTTSIGVGWISFNCLDDSTKRCDDPLSNHYGVECTGLSSPEHKFCNSQCIGGSNSGDPCVDSTWCFGGGVCDDGSPNPSKCVDACAFVPYAVTLDLKPSQPVIYEVIPNPDDKCHGLMVRWREDTGSFQTDFRVYRQDNDLSDPAIGTEIGSVPGDAYQYPDYSPQLSPGDHFYYFVDAYDSNVPISSEMSEPLDGTTYLICKVDGSAISGIGECPNKITLSWPEDPNAGYYNIIRCNLTDSVDCGVLGNYYGNADYEGEGWSQLPVDDLYETTDSCYSPDSSHCSGGTCSCVDEEISYVPADGEMYDEYVYKVQTASSTLGQYSSWSEPSDPIRPCTMFPVWREVR